MRPLSLWRHEVRRAGWTALLAPLATAAALGVVAVDGAVRLEQPSGDTALLLATLLEVWLLLLAGALSFLGPQLMPTPLFRVAVVGLWFWAGATEIESEFPSLAGTVLSLTMDYPLRVFFGSVDASAGPAGAPLDFLRPQPTTATALLAVALMVGLAAAILAAARALNARTSR